MHYEIPRAEPCPSAGKFCLHCLKVKPYYTWYIGCVTYSGTRMVYVPPARWASSDKRYRASSDTRGMPRMLLGASRRTTPVSVDDEEIDLLVGVRERLGVCLLLLVSDAGHKIIMPRLAANCTHVAYGVMGVQKILKSSQLNWRKGRPSDTIACHCALQPPGV